MQLRNCDRLREIISRKLDAFMEWKAKSGYPRSVTLTSKIRTKKNRSKSKKS